MKNDIETDHYDLHLISYHALRALVGLLGLLLTPILISVGYIMTKGFQTSLSQYFHVELASTFFIGILFAIGAFLITYKGDPNSNEGHVSTFAGVMAFATAIIPTDKYCDGMEEYSIYASLHLGAAALFLLTTAIISYCYFARTPKVIPRRIYKTVGVIIFLCVVGAGVVTLFEGDIGTKIAPPNCDASMPTGFGVLIFEAIAVIAFGTAWLIKGEDFIDWKRSPETSNQK